MHDIEVCFRTDCHLKSLWMDVLVYGRWTDGWAVHMQVDMLRLDQHLGGDRTEGGWKLGTNPKKYSYFSVPRPIFNPSL